MVLPIAANPLALLLKRYRDTRPISSESRLLHRNARGYNFTVLYVPIEGKFRQQRGFFNMKRALLVIDVQNEYFTGKLPISYPQDSLEHIVQAMDAANEAEIPVVLIQHTAPQPDSATFRRASQEWELHPEVTERKHATLIEKNLPGSFTGTQLEMWLRERGIDSVVISGYMTQMCCDTTARQAMHLGFGVEFLSDATGTLAFKNSAGEIDAEELHRAILVTQQIRFSDVLPTETWIARIQDEK